jgi:hypothetical protein
VSLADAITTAGTPTKFSSSVVSFFDVFTTSGGVNLLALSVVSSGSLALSAATSGSLALSPVSSGSLALNPRP